MQADETHPVRHAYLPEAVVCPAEFGGIIPRILCQRLCRAFARGCQCRQEVAKRPPMGWNPELGSLLRSICSVRHLLDAHHIAGPNNPLIFSDQFVEELADAHFDEDQVMENLA